MNILLRSILLAATLNSGYVIAQDFQQQVDHKIAVKLNDVTHTLSGNIATVYQNNSKDTLRYIYYHLYPNAYKNNQTAFAKQYLADGKVDFHFNKPADRGFIDSLQFNVNDKQASIEHTAHIDVIKLILPEPILPGGKATINTPFFVKLPLVYSRLGHNGQEYQISQWFPKPAVYDKNGWNAFPYLNLGEYYSDFGNYEVKITLPENYVVLATGNIQEASEEAWLDTRAKSKPQVGAASSSTYKTITFKEENVHDFAWFASKDWAIKKETFKIANTANEVTAYVGYNPKHEQGWKDVMKYVKNTINTYSEHVGTYPYKTVKVAEGALEAGGGMEYPTVTVIQQSNDADFIEQVTVHEIGHNWFYGILANNERTSPWLDESINSFYERKTVMPKTEQMSKLMSSLEAATLQGYVAYNSLQPLCSHSAHLTNMNYGLDLYQKGPDYIAYLEAYMGADAFKKGMRAYFNQYKFKHVDAAKLQAVLAQHTDKSLDWFFKDLIQKSETVDFSIKKVSNGFKVKNHTSYEAPMGITTVIGSDSSFHLPFELIAPNTSAIFNSVGDVGFINAHVADYKTNNNSSNKGIKLNAFIPLHPQPGHNIALAPALGYNYNNGFMLGALIHNIGIPQQKFEFLVAPMYGFTSKSLAGTAYAGYNIYTDGLFQHVKLSVNAKHYAYQRIDHDMVNNKLYPHYTTIKPEVYIDFKKSNPRSPIQHTLILRGHFINEENIKYVTDTVSMKYDVLKDNSSNRNYFTADYIYDNTSTLNPHSVRTYVHTGSHLFKLGLEAKLKTIYNQRKDAIHWRAFASLLLHPDRKDYNYSLHTTNTWQNDYLYEDTYVKRGSNTGFFANQSYQREGGFYTNTMMYGNPLGLSDQFLAALNINVDIPRTPLQVFINGAYKGGTLNYSEHDRVLYEAGIVLKATPLIDIAFPLLVSQEINDYQQYILGKNKFAKSISFRINLTDFNASRFIQKKLMGIRM